MLRATIYGVLMTIAAQVMIIVLGGCGAQLAPTGMAGYDQTTVDEFAPDGKTLVKRTTKVVFRNDKDTSVGEFSYNSKTGDIKLADLTSNGSTAASIRANMTTNMSRDFKEVFLEGIKAARSIMPGGGSATPTSLGDIISIGGGTPVTGTTPPVVTPPATAALSPLKEKALAKLTACPFIPDEAKPAMASKIKDPATTDQQVIDYAKKYLKVDLTQP